MQRAGLAALLLAGQLIVALPAAQGAPVVGPPDSQDLQTALAAANKAAAAAVAAAAGVVPAVPNPDAAQVELDKAGAQGLDTVPTAASRLARPLTIDGRVPRGVVQAYASFEAAVRQAEAAAATAAPGLAENQALEAATPPAALATPFATTQTPPTPSLPPAAPVASSPTALTAPSQSTPASSVAATAPTAQPLTAASAAAVALTAAAQAFAAAAKSFTPSPTPLTLATSTLTAAPLTPPAFAAAPFAPPASSLAAPSAPNPAALTFATSAPFTPSLAITTAPAATSPSLSLPSALALAASAPSASQAVPASATLAAPAAPAAAPRPRVWASRLCAGVVLGASYLFYEAQRSGCLPADNRVPWRSDAHTNDLVPGGWYDAGDYIKHSLTIAQSAAFLAWGAIDFGSGQATAGQAQYAQAAVKWAADYLQACHIAPDRFVGLIGNPDIDHNFWGRPQDQNTSSAKRPAYIWNLTSQGASDLLGISAAALASASVLLRDTHPADAASYLLHAQQLYAAGNATKGLFSKTYPNYPWVYASDYFNDKLQFAAGWLYRATGNASYLVAAHRHWRDAGGWSGDEVSPYVSYDAVYGPAAVLLLGIARDTGSANVPGHSQYLAFINDFRDIWVGATGRWGIVKTPLGMRRPNWSKWGNLRYASNAAMTLLLRASQLAQGGAERATLLGFAKSQVDYALGTSYRSFVVGWGVNPPVRAHHAGASCPNLPAPCGWSNFDSPNPNPQVLTGALVAGPMGPGDDTYHDKRDDYVSNEVTIDYNAGFTAALAGLIALGE
ncbi:hypothetical protein ABPG75_012134 [Micractinium tetrahymenae]